MGEFDQSHGHVLTRAGGALQAGAGAVEAVGGGLTALAGVGETATGVGAEAGLPAAVGGVALAANGLDNMVAGLRTAIIGEPTHTLVARGAGAAAHLVGASPRTAERISTGVDVAQGFAAADGSALGTVAREGLGPLRKRCSSSSSSSNRTRCLPSEARRTRRSVALPPRLELGGAARVGTCGQP